MGVKIVGRESDLPFDITVDQAADFFRKEFPDLWKQVYTKHIEAPGNYYNFKAPAVTICAGIVESSRGEAAPAAQNIAIASAIQAQWDFPTYYVSKELLQSLQHTHPPRGMTWDQTARPFDGMIFMLPRGFLREPEINEDVHFIGFAYAHARATNLRIPGLGTGIRQAEYDGIIIYYGVHGGLVLQSFGCPGSQSLEPEPGWITKRTEYWDKLRPVDHQVARPSAEFLSYLAGLVGNLLLLMTARPEMVEPKHTGPRKILRKQNVDIVPARFIGRKYEVKRETPTTVQTGAHFTKLVWRSGHFRLQHYGKGNLLTKTPWIEPYICLGAGLVTKEGV